jgi:hypothetical protein
LKLYPNNSNLSDLECPRSEYDRIKGNSIKIQTTRQIINQILDDAGLETLKDGKSLPKRIRSCLMLD